MSTNDSVSAAPQEHQPRTADTSGSTLPTGPDYSIAPEDQHIADRLMNFDVVSDVPSPNTVKGSPRMTLPDKLSVKMLSPDARAEIEAKLKDVPLHQVESREDALVREHLMRNAAQVRMKAGAGEGANPFQRERLLIAGERDQANREIIRLMGELAEVSRWEPIFDEISGEKVIDPKTGQQELKPVYRVDGQRRVGMERRVDELSHKITLLDGPEGDLRERKALHAAVQAKKALKAQIEEERDARELGDKIARDERVRRRAEARAKAQRTAL